VSKKIFNLDRLILQDSTFIEKHLKKIPQQKTYMISENLLSCKHDKENLNFARAKKKIQKRNAVVMYC
jgi:hypothetical protein